MSSKSWIHLFILAIFFTLGHYNLAKETSLPQSSEHIFYYAKEPEEVVLIGRLAKMITFDGDVNRLLLESEYISLNHSPGTLLPTSGHISLSLKNPQRAPFLPGQRLAIRAKIKRPTSFIGEGVFDYARFLAQKDIWVTGFISNILYIQNIDDDLPPPFFSQIRYSIETCRDSIGRFFDRTTTHAGLYRALLLGDKSLLSSTTITSFQQCGLAHILAISGLHIAVLSSVIYAAILFLLKRSHTILLRINVYKCALLLTLPAILFYASLTGMQAPVSRALVMFIFVVIAICIERVKSPLVLVAASALLLLIIDPRLLFQASFLLSYSAITGIVLSLPLLKLFSTTKTGDEKTSRRVVRAITMMFVVSTVASLATLPVSLFFFNKISLIGPITNILIEPLICLFTLPLGFFALCSFPLSESIAQICLDLGSLSIFLTERIVLFCAQLPFSHKWLPQPPIWLMAIFYASFFMLLNTLYTNKRVLPPLVVLIASITLMWFSPQEIGKKWFTKSSVNILDVGKGSANFIEFQGGYRILIDGGGPQFTKGSIGERVMAPYLWKKGVQKIDAIYLTHGDADHYNGIQFILDHFDVDRVLIAHKEYYNDGFKRFIEKIGTSGIIVEIMSRGQKHHYGKAVVRCVENLTLSHPQPYMRNKGIVLRLEIQGYTVLFPGDIHSKEEHIVASNSNVQSNILLASHHGSKTSSSEIFLKATQPSLIIISANSNSPYFPAPHIEQRYKNHALPYFSTATHGSLTLLMSQSNVTLKGVKNRPVNPFAQKKVTELFNIDLNRSR